MIREESREKLKLMFVGKKPANELIPSLRFSCRVAGTSTQFSQPHANKAMICQISGRIMQAETQKEMRRLTIPFLNHM